MKEAEQKDQNRKPREEGSKFHKGLRRVYTLKSKQIPLRRVCLQMLMRQSRRFLILCLIIERFLLNFE